MPEALTESHFKPGDVFRIEDVTDEPLTLTVEETKSLGRGVERPTFSVVFGGPEAPILPQAIYRLKHPDHGELGVFLVPLGPMDGDPSILYEAVFT